MRRLIRCSSLGLIVFLLWAGTAVHAAAHGDHPDPLSVTFEQNMNVQVPLIRPFLDETGRPVTLGDYVGNKPAILFMGYYECPTLCINVVFPELVKSLRQIDSLQAGKDFSVISVSIDTGETPTVAARTKAKFVGPADHDEGWHLLTGKQDAIDEVANAIGFHYAYDAKQDEYAHPSGIVVLTPDGRVSRYFMGVEYEPLDVRLSLIEAGKGTVGTAVDQLLLLCYHYDPENGRYNNVIWAVVRVLGLGLMLGLGGIVWRLTREQKE